MKNKYLGLGLPTMIMTALMSSGVIAEDGVVVYQNYEERFEENQAQFSQTGISGETPSVIKGYGKDVPFPISLDIIVPQHWDVSFNEGSENLLVNWETGENGLAWNYVLEDLSKRNNISVAIDWERKNVNFFAHEAKNDHFEYLANRDESYIVDAEGNRIELEQILVEQAEYSRMNEVLRREVEDRTAALEENERLIAEMQAQMEQQALEEDLNENYGGGLNMVSNVDGDTATIGFEEEVYTEGLEVSLEELREEYDQRTVLPYDGSFEFYKAGGWRQDIDFLTPATYIAKRGKTVFEIVEGWGSEIGWEVTYNSNIHYTIDYDIEFKGLARESMIEFISLYESANRPLDIKFYPNQKLIVIEDLVFERRRF